ncbi:MAG: hypothetical protein IJ759_00100 [Bacteroidales bacterium]|nr:hypothetical protein [Bacteroidales bacterium]
MTKQGKEALEMFYQACVDEGCPMPPMNIWIKNFEKRNFIHIWRGWRISTRNSKRSFCKWLKRQRYERDNSLK